jgi:hypothetical protein
LDRRRPDFLTDSRRSQRQRAIYSIHTYLLVSKGQLFINRCNEGFDVFHVRAGVYCGVSSNVGRSTFTVTNSEHDRSSGSCTIQTDALYCLAFILVTLNETIVAAIGDTKRFSIRGAYVDSRTGGRSWRFISKPYLTFNN